MTMMINQWMEWGQNHEEPFFLLWGLAMTFQFRYGYQCGFHVKSSFLGDWLLMVCKSWNLLNGFNMDVGQNGRPLMGPQM